MTGAHEATDLQNIDFSRVGAWSQRQGSTLYQGMSTSARVLGVYEYEKLQGYSAIMSYNSSGIFYTAGSSFYGLFVGTSTLTYGVTVIAGNTTKAFVGGSPRILSLDNNVFDQVTFLNSLYLSNGTNLSFFKYLSEINTMGYQGFTAGSQYKFAYQYSLPPGGYSLQATSISIAINLGTSLQGGATGNGFVYLGYGWMDIFGFRSAPTLVPSQGFTLLGGSFLNSINIVYSPSLIPWDFGYTAMSIYMSNPGGTQLFLVGDLSEGNGSDSAFTTNRASFEEQFVGGVSLVLTTLNMGSAYSNRTFPLTGDPARYPLFFTLAPRYLEIYNNQLFMAGFTTYNQTSVNGTSLSSFDYQSTMFWSEIAEPEFVDPSFFDEVRTNDGDRITGLRSYNNTLIITKQRSFHRLFGTSATDISIQQVSDQYGCLSNQAMAVYNQQLLFLDRKGICKWDGANVGIISTKIEPIFQRMNIAAAIDSACAVHLKLNNQVWFAIPVDGSTLNNLTVVYDYFSDAWTTFNGVVPSVMTIAKGRNNEYNTFYGSYSGLISNFGSSLPSDNGVAMTCQIKTMFYRDLGQSTEKQFRRLFMNTDIMSTTATILSELIPDYGTSSAVSVTMAVGGFQNRIDFGVPAKAMQFRFTYFNATLPIRINGITVESRYQRSV